MKFVYKSVACMRISISDIEKHFEDI